MTIRNIDSFVSSLWDWGMLDDCFPGTKIKVTDIDGAVERRGKFLILETKKKGVPVPVAQQIMFERFQETGLFTVVVVWGDKNQAEEMQVYYPQYKTEKKAATNEDLKNVVKWWFDYANKA